MQEEGDEEEGEGNEGEEDWVGVEGEPASADGGGNPREGEEVDEAESGEGAGDEVGDVVPQDEECPEVDAE